MPITALSSAWGALSSVGPERLPYKHVRGDGTILATGYKGAAKGSSRS